MIEMSVRRAAVASLLVSLTVGAAFATSVVAKSFRAISTEADEIFAATVTDVRSYRRDGGAIWTAVTFGELTWFAGEPQPEVELEFAGGTVDDVSQIIGGMPRFRVGERVLLFVRDRGTISPIVGFHQGCFALAPGEDGEVVVMPDRRPVLSVEADGLAFGVAGETDGAIRLQDLMDEVAAMREAGE